MAIKVKKKNDSFGLKSVTIGNCNKVIHARYAKVEVNPEFYKQFESTMDFSDKKIQRIK